MKIRRFFAKDMRNALQQVTQELGQDAAILSSCKVSGGVEVVAATDYDEALLHAHGDEKDLQMSVHQEQVIETGNRSNTGVNATESVANSIDLKSLSDKGFSLDSLLKKLNQVSHQNPAQSHKKNNPYSKPAKTRETHPQPELGAECSVTTIPEVQTEKEQKFPSIVWSQEPTLVAMREELNLLRNFLQNQVSDIAWANKRRTSPISVALTQQLADLGLTSTIIQSLVNECEQEKDRECAWQRALALLAKRINDNDDELVGTQRIVALVGPTGVGKTTTVAKLAAQQVLRYGAQSVALISTDSYRIAAHDQIKTYARILQIPMRVVNDENEFHEALQHFSDKSLILVDTAGISQRDERMTQQLRCLSQDKQKVEFCLVLSATSQVAVLQDALRSFKVFNPNGCIVTKLDEAASLGEIISTIITHNLKVLYTTDGQRVPEDIRVARSHHLVSKMVWLARQHASNNDIQQATGTH